MRPGEADDIAAIHRLLASHLQAITHDDVGGMAATFAADGELVLPWATVRGRAQIAAYLTEHRRAIGRGNREFYANLIIEIDGSIAVATHTTVVIRAGVPPPQILGSATCTNILHRSGPDWLIARQSIVADPSYDPAIGTLADVVERLARRVQQLEEAQRRAKSKRRAQ